jgi:low temperature requirement protein LtrA
MTAGLQRHVHATDDAHRVTSLELFFDLVFVFGLTQVTALMAQRTTWTGALEGLIVLSLMWFAWTAYAWLGNQARADEGVLRVGLVAAMVALLVVGLAIPQAFGEQQGSLDAALVLAVGFVVARLVHLTVYLIAAGEDAALRRQLFLTSIPVAVWAVLLVAGSFADGGLRLAVWALALTVDYGGIFVSSRAGGWRVHAAGHFAERHGLIVLIAIGESIVAIGVTATELPLTWPVLIAVLLGLAVSVTLWWSYFDVVAPVAERVLARAQGQERVRIARDSYSYLHFPMVVGIVFLALGMKKVVSYVADTSAHDLSDPLSTVALVALYGGMALYLVAHIFFRLRNVHSVNVQRSVVAGLLVVLMPVAARLPALAALGLLCALMVGLILYEVTRHAAARQQVRHAAG